MSVASCVFHHRVLMWLLRRRICRHTSRKVLLVFALSAAAIAPTIIAQATAQPPTVHTHPPVTAPGRTIVADLPLVYPNDSGYASIAVTVGTRDSLLVLVDLGATRSFLWPATRDRLGTSVQSAGSVTVTGWSGDAESERAIIDSVRVGKLVRRELPVLIMDLPARARRSKAAFAHLDGMLGRDVFEGYDVEFDFPAHRFRIYEAVTPASSPGAPPTWSGVRGLRCVRNLAGETGMMREMIVIPIQVNDHEVPAEFDTGAPRTVLALETAARIGITPASAGVVMTDSGGTAGIGNALIRKYRTDKVRVMVAHEALHAGPVVFADVHMSRSSSLSDELQPAAVLGLNSIADRRVFVASSTNEVCFGR